MISLNDLITEGAEWVAAFSDPEIDYLDDVCLFEWASKSLMYLQEKYPHHPQTAHFEQYLKRENLSYKTCNYMLAILKAFEALNPSSQPIEYDEILKKIFNRFHEIANQLRRRYNDRTSLIITDEYDVQDLLHTLLKLHFDDVRPEEWTPSYAGGNNRMDFLIKDEEIAIDVKMTRKGLKDKEIGDQLIIDIAKYRGHPNCKKIFCFVYDKEGILRNPRGLERDLEAISSSVPIKVFIRPL